jgi:quinol monooxygenase YgiN
MDYVLITHEVADYSAWKNVFDRAASLRKEAGERSYQLLHYEGEPNTVVHFSTWTSLANAKSFFASPRLVRLREEAGVKAPEFVYLVPLESGIL